MKWFVVGLLGLVWAIAAAETGLGVISLRHRLAEDIALQIKPLLEPGEVVIPNRAGLIIKATPERISDLTAVVQELDRAQHRLRITVIQGRGLTLDALNAGANVGIQVGVGSSVDARGHIYQTTGRDIGESVQQVQTLDGQSAVIQAGAQVPVGSAGIGVSPYGVPLAIIQGGQFVDVSSGFAVTPRLSGDQVNLDIKPWAERFDRRGTGAIETQSASTVLRVGLGEWTEIGGEVETRDLQENGLFAHRYSTRTESNRIFLKVDDLDSGSESERRPAQH